MTPQIELNNDRLTFTFPEIATQLSALAEEYIQQILPSLKLPRDRTELEDALLNLINEGQRELKEQVGKSLEESANSLTAADVEKAFREAVRSASGIRESLATMSIEFQRTLRIPDDGKTYPLPAGLGAFPLRSVDDFADTLPDSWLKRGGVLMPMYQSEALWIRFSSRFPFAVKIASGKVNAISGEPWTPELRGEPQNYIVLPEQPWLDGFSVGEGIIRQFVAMPLGDGYSVEEQITGKADIGGLQIQAHPMSAENYFHDEVKPRLPATLEELLPVLFADHLRPAYRRILACAPRSSVCESSIGLGAGGKMRQEIYEDTNPVTVWDQTQSRRCFVHLCNSLVWRQFTGANPPHPPLTSTEYKNAGIPWFDYYRDDQSPLKGSKVLASVKTVLQLGKEKNTQPLPDNNSIVPETLIQYGNTRRPREIREFLDI